MQFATKLDQRAGFEGAKIQLFVVEGCLRFRISSQEHLESPIKKKPINLVGANSASNLF